MPALVLLLAAALAAVTTVRAQLECVDAARDAVLAAARGEDGTRAGLQAAPPGSTVGVSDQGATVRAVVSVRVQPLGGRLPGFTVSGSATAAKEPTAP
jgi:hypothetical protein